MKNIYNSLLISASRHSKKQGYIEIIGLNAWKKCLMPKHDRLKKITWYVLNNNIFASITILVLLIQISIWSIGKETSIKRTNVDRYGWTEKEIEGRLRELGYNERYLK